MTTTKRKVGRPRKKPIKLKGKSFNVATNKAKPKKEDHEMKTYNNKTYSKLGNKKGPQFVLDGPEINTTKALINAGWPKINIYIPNNSKDYIPIKKRHMNTNPISAGELIDDLVKENVELGGANLDYMGTPDGNKTQNVNPKEDITKLFKYQMFLNNAVLSVTFSPRAKTKTKLKWFCAFQTQNFIMNTAQKYGYNLELYDGGTYFNNCSMYTLTFIITKVKLINKSVYKHNARRITWREMILNSIKDKAKTSTQIAKELDIPRLTVTKATPFMKKEKIIVCLNPRDSANLYYIITKKGLKKLDKYRGIK